MINYELAKAEGPKLKAALTRAKKSGKAQSIINACGNAFQRFEAWGAWPDNWRLWGNALQDAVQQARREGLTDIAAAGRQVIQDYGIGQ